jgi:hypothetical protein
LPAQRMLAVLRAKATGTEGAACGRLPDCIAAGFIASVNVAPGKPEVFRLADPELARRAAALIGIDATA